MTSAQRIVRRLRQAQDLAAELDNLESEIRAAGTRRNGKRTPSRQAQRREERNERAAQIRAVVMERAGVNCEWCGAANLRLELHHVISGPSRRSAESVETCAAICPDCHRLLHRNSGAALVLARIWAERGSYSVALIAIQRRIEKLTEANK